MKKLILAILTVLLLGCIKEPIENNEPSSIPGLELTFLDLTTTITSEQSTLLTT